jgi:DNA-binding transcriptional regulator YdaS (Cro superfamily)
VTSNDLDIRTLRRAGEIAGGMEALALRLKVSPTRLALWLAGEAPLPQAIFLRAIDIVLEHEHAALRHTGH